VRLTWEGAEFSTHVVFNYRTVTFIASAEPDESSPVFLCPNC
jgi:hypothetical protein